MVILKFIISFLNFGGGGSWLQHTIFVVLIQDPSLLRTDSLVVAHGLSCSVACGVLVPQPFPELQGGFLTTGPRGKSRSLIPGYSGEWVLCVPHVPCQDRGSGGLGDDRSQLRPCTQTLLPKSLPHSGMAPAGAAVSQQQLRRETGKPSPVAQGSLFCTASPELRRGVTEASAAALLRPSLSSGQPQ